MKLTFHSRTEAERGTGRKSEFFFLMMTSMSVVHIFISRNSIIKEWENGHVFVMLNSYEIGTREVFFIIIFM